MFKVRFAADHVYSKAYIPAPVLLLQKLRTISLTMIIIMLQALFKPYATCRQQTAHKGCPNETFTDAPLKRTTFCMDVQRVYSSFYYLSLLPLPPSCIFFFFHFLFSSSVSLVLASSPRLLFLWSLVILREIFWFTSIPHSPQRLRLCVPLVISIQSPHSATYFTVSRIKTWTMALRGSFSG